MDNQNNETLHCVHGALIKNERLKLYKKPSTWILTGIVVVCIQLLLLLSYQIYKSISSVSEDMWQTNYNDQIGEYNQQLTENPNQPQIQSAKECLTYLLDNAISPTDWRTDAAEEYFNLKYGLPANVDFYTDKVQSYVPQNTLDPSQTERLSNQLKTILDNQDWTAYVHYKIDNLQSGVTASANESEKQVDIDILNLYLEYNIAPISSGQYSIGGSASSSGDSWKGSQIQTIRSYKLALLRGESANGELLSHTQRSSYSKSIDVALKRLSTNTKPVSMQSFLGLLESSAGNISWLIVMLVVIAGGIISNEYATGTVKLLLITPHKRNRIFMAKTGLLVEISAIALGAAFILSFLTCGLLYQFKGIGDMQVMSLFGNVVRFPYLLYIVARYLLLMLPVFVYGAMALMLSAVTRKTAVSIAIPILIWILGSSIVSILIQIKSTVTIPGIKFFLCSNTSLESYLPSASASFNAGASGQMIDSTMTLGFSVVILLVYMACFLWIAHDSFCRRDVK